MNSRATTQWHNPIFAPVLAMAVVLVVVWWAFPEDLTLWRSIAIVTAWAGSALLVVNLILMVREPHLAHLLGGLESAYLLHHRSGMMAYLLLLIHPLALALDGWIEAPHLAWEILAPWMQSWPVWLGWVALLFLMLGLSTTFALRLPYRTWRRFHFLLGFGVVLGLIHIYVLLGEVGFNLIALALIALALLALGWRFITSDLGVAAYPYHVTRVTRQSTDMIEASLQPSATTLSVSSGQFVLVAFGDGAHFHGCGEYHPFTVSNVAVDGELKLAIKALGPCSQRIQNIEPGVLVHLQGPFGTFLTGTTSTPQLWVAGGVGITPFIAVLREHLCTQPTTLIYLFRTKADAAFLGELTTHVKADPQFELCAVETGKAHVDFPSLLQQINQLAQREVNICGPELMVNALLPHLRQRGVNPDAIHFERFDFR